GGSGSLLTGAPAAACSAVARHRRAKGAAPSAPRALGTAQEQSSKEEMFSFLVFFEKHLTFLFTSDTLVVPNKLNMQAMGVFSLFREYLYPFFYNTFLWRI
ncbi:MAG: hypothetical protein J6V07_04400, partial [Clostridia bacterium]|nr:hypothetical protein [Clostridia bacterium]